MTTLAFMDFAFNWWENLNLAKQIFYGTGLLSGLLALILAVLSFVGIEGQDAFDAVDDFGHEGGGGIFSVKPLTGFFLGFGWVGGIALDAGWSIGAATLAAVVAGGALMSLLVVMIRFMMSMRTDGTMRIGDAVGVVGTVYITLPPGRADGGQVMLNLGGRRETLAAFSAGDQPIPSGTRVRVVEVIDARSVLVEPLV
ncbi:hypothetical protein Ga0100231_016945 [Opitutaceae bacterium TAV4]|uniref:NfeD family protein n=1 Tax=Geminisphaera colitermitum TaxID=1148786 RepID=UPI00019650DD|nr:NfeD family protein [Geminisphaera colitermitum]RRJ95720.1 hypothetical protein Ga0100231_016945 [Opitutaceae bacterium TAV4]RRJ99685.1 hypothetical protein Ga0100230_016460 [Opitutaceae bacterium TAV3]